MNAFSSLASDYHSALLAPLAEDAPCGPALRYDPVFTEIRLLREEDDPSLPMGQWERPLKHADWPRIEALCSSMLATRSKDVQIAAWLAESWMRQRSLAGLRDGLVLLNALLARYWPQLHPVIDGDDADARLAPFEWLNESLAASVRVHATLLNVDDGKPWRLTLAVWERMTASELAPVEVNTRGKAVLPPDPPEPTRPEVAALAWTMGPALAEAAALVAQCLDALDAMSAFLHAQLGDLAPNLGKFAQVLEGAARMLAQLHVDDEGDDGDEGGEDEPEAALPAAQPELHTPVAAPAIASAMPAWRNRAEAYATLAALADYISSVEPHSPTPFLIRRAVNWGRMSLPEVIAEIIREEGDVSRLFNVLGVPTQARD